MSRDVHPRHTVPITQLNTWVWLQVNYHAKSHFDLTIWIHCDSTGSKTLEVQFLEVTIYHLLFILIFTQWNVGLFRAISDCSIYKMFSYAYHKSVMFTNRLVISTDAWSELIVRANRNNSLFNEFVTECLFPGCYLAVLPLKIGRDPRITKFNDDEIATIEWLPVILCTSIAIWRTSHSKMFLTVDRQNRHTSWRQRFFT